VPELSADQQEKLHRLELIAEIFDICNSTNNLNDLMERVFKRIILNVGAEAGSLWLIDEAQTEISCQVAEGTTRDKVVGMKLAKGTGIVGWVIDNAASSTVYDTSTDPRFSTQVDQKTGFRTRSMICAPLIVENTAIGAVQLLNKKTADGRFGDSDLSLLRMLCQSSATPIVNARLRQSTQKVQELSTLLEISKEITSTLDLDSCLLSVVNLSSKLIPYDRAVIALAERGGLRISAVSGQVTVDRQDPDIVHLHTMLDNVAKKGADVYIPVCRKYLKDEKKEPSIEEYINRYHPGSLAVYRLFDDESELGLFMLESKKENIIAGSLTERLSILRNIMTVALRNAQLYASVPSLSLFKKSGKAGWLPLKTAIIATAALIALVAALGLARLPYNVAGSFEIQPQQKYMLYTRVDAGVVKQVFADPSRPVLKGDTLLAFDIDELVKQRLNKRNDILQLQQKMEGLKQQSRYADFYARELELQKLQLELVGLNRAIENSYIRSPVDGMFATGDIRNLVGRRFSRGDELVEIIPTGALQLRLFIPEADILRILPNQRCVFRVPAYPGKTFRGTVTQIAFDVNKESGVSFPVLVTVDNADIRLLPGMSGKGKIRTGPRSLLVRLLAKPRELLATKLWL
jgi:transcriptional regulator with GAF, ATPase, and Fis domain/multidrug efflux pump subunit AcrA (membrane-fusion protein)